MDQSLVAMTPNFTVDGDQLLYSAASSGAASGEIEPHNIYQYDLNTLQTKKLTTGDHFDFMPMSIGEENILFIRYKGDGYYSLVELVEEKEKIIVDNIILDYNYKDNLFGYYGHVEIEKGIDIFLDK